MMQDPDRPPSPYDALAGASVTPWTSHAELRDVPFELLARRLMTPAAQAALERLRTVPGRLLVDLFLYDVDVAAELPGAVAELDRLLAGAAGPDAGEPLPDEAVAGLLDELIRFDV
ncbi:hypothetical protein [Streptomyces sp. AN091965]|uniref:hypothetical protein n=1 Tax=Streptomyces sp. AN091965 TaxID=2927803 RepID=UPI001F610104|nr:hypothetical protein [Streptomyces sp. AN091965]MCI3933701.1 hypothetical protein [Streptomyces sp. AN091965]